MVARTILQHAVPTTFGLKAAGWLTAIVEARVRLEQVSRERLAAQLGGAAGTLAGFGDDGISLLDLYARELDLPVPTLPVAREPDAHRRARRGARDRCRCRLEDRASTSSCSPRPRSARWPKAEARDVPRRCRRSGTRSARRSHARTHGSPRLMPACSSGRSNRSTSAPPAPGRPSGPLCPARWRYTGGALHALAGALESLEVDSTRMRQNLDLTGGLVMAERVAFLLMDRLGRAEAQEIVREAAASGTSFRDALLADPRAGLEPAALDAALDPSTYLGSDGRARRPRARALRELAAAERGRCVTLHYRLDGPHGLRHCCCATRSGRRSRCGIRRLLR